MMPPPGWLREGNLPEEATGFVGRQDEAARLQALTMASRLVTVVGMGGVGKTRLAVHTAHSMRDNFADGVWLADLSLLNSSDLLVHSLMAIFGLRDRSGRSALSVLIAFLAAKQMLIVFDTCDRHVGAFSSLIRTVLEAAPGVTAMATSREPLGVAEERRFPLAPLPVPCPDRPMGSLRDNDAVALFLDRGKRLEPGFRPSAEDLEVIAEICRRLDGVPLAIELAAGRLPTYTPREILDLLADQHRVLDGGIPTGLPRHRTLRAAIGWSHRLCGPDEQLLWARLSVFASDFTLEAAEYVCSCADLPAPQISGALNDLVAKSILLRGEGPDGVRYRLADTLRAYGAERREERGESTWLSRRYRDYYMDLARRGEAAWSGARQPEWFDRMMGERAHIRAVMEQCLDDPGEAEHALSFAGSLWFLWHACGLTREGRYYLDRALGLSREPGKTRCKALWVLAFVCTGLGDIGGARRAAQRCMAEAVKIGDADAVVMATKMTGLCAYVTGDLPGARAYLGAALGSLPRDGHLNPGLLPAIVELAFVLNAQREPEDAESLLRECLEQCEKHGELWVRSWALSAMAETHRALGRTGEALASARESLSIKRRFHDVLGLLSCLEMLAWLSLDDERSDRRAAAHAATLIGAADAGWRHFGLHRLFEQPALLANARACEAKARQILGDTTYKEAMERGMTYDLNSAITYALEH